MIIISDYTLVLKEDFGVFVESSENSHICPVCQGTLHYRDSRPRIRKKEGGTKGAADDSQVPLSELPCLSQ